MLYGSQYASKFSAKLYIKPYTTAFAKPTGATVALQVAAALAALEGTAAVSTFIVDAMAVDGDYVIVSSPTNAYALYCDKDGAGAKRADVVTAAQAAGCSAVLAAVIATADMSDVDAIGVALAAAINTTDDLTATYTAGTNTLVATATRGGTRVLASSIAGVATPGTWAVTDTAGTGDWTPVGSIAEDYTVDTEAEELIDAEGNTITLYDTVTAEFRFLNLTQRNIDILKDYRGTRISMIIADLTDRAAPELYCINDLLFNVKITPAGDAKAAPIKLTKRIKNSLTGTYFWSYDTDVV
jgi:hypothetical protein